MFVNSGRTTMSTFFLLSSVCVCVCVWSFVLVVVKVEWDQWEHYWTDLWWPSENKWGTVDGHWPSQPCIPCMKSIFILIILYWILYCYALLIDSWKTKCQCETKHSILRKQLTNLSEKKFIKKTNARQNKANKGLIPTVCLENNDKIIAKAMKNLDII